MVHTKFIKLNNMITNKFEIQNGVKHTKIHIRTSIHIK